MSKQAHGAVSDRTAVQEVRLAIAAQPDAMECRAASS
jgi:hypothetical protein